VLRRRLFGLVVCAAALAACRRSPLPEVERADRDSAAGRRIFERRCASCHNGNGDGNTITASHFPYANLIDGVWRSDGSLAAIERQVRVGHDPMPRFEGKLTDEEIRQVSAYVEALARSAERRRGKAAAGTAVR
jgi:mono/diheme cytochrome c family protein